MSLKVKQLIKKLQKMDPDAIVVYAIDDESNAFHEVQFEPQQGKFLDNQFVGDKEIKDSPADYGHIDRAKNAVCIN